MTIPTEELDLAGHEGHLNTTQQEAFNDLKEQVEQELGKNSSSSSSIKWYDDTTLLRFLRARSFNVPKALKQFMDTDTWRRERNIDQVYREFPVNDLEAARMYYPRWTGRRDRLGRPLYVYRISSLTKEHQKEIYKQSEEKRYQTIVTLTELLQQFIFELCSRIPSASTPTPICCVTTIIDLDGISFGQIWSLRSHLQQSMTLSSAHYPETLSTIAIVNAPSYFTSIWSLVSKYFDEGTRRKVHVLGATPGPALQAIIKAEDLPKVYGGELDWKFEDDPILDDEVKEAVGTKTLPPGSLVWEDAKVKEVGSGRS
ncbi:hypothetical protein CBS101457_000061 [Exobasidium rhododendri]|nr:hypothetical protein CBS101457_000061 [Exobasidium rhododendri]